MSSQQAKVPIRFTASWASVLFDLLRGIAAFLVLFEHWRNFFFVDFHSVTRYRPALSLFYALATAGHQAVVVFFVLSGYFIGGSAFRSLERNQWSWGEYLLRRIVRLWIVLVPALLFGLFWDRLGIHLGHAPGLYTGHASQMVGDIAPVLTPTVFFGNLFFLQTIYTTTFGSNGSLWSLANEFWYYILFPLALIVFYRNQRPVHRVACAVLFLATAWFVGKDILINSYIWVAGVVLFKLRPPSLSPRTARYLRILATLLYVPVFFRVGRLPLALGHEGDLLLTLVTVVYLWLLLSATEAYPEHDRTAGLSRELARFSFTLYAVHAPFLVYLVASLLGDSRWYPTPIHLVAGFGVLAVALGYSYGLAFLTEFRTDALRLRLERWFGIASAPPMLPSNPLSQSSSSGLSMPPASVRASGISFNKK